MENPSLRTAKADFQQPGAMFEGKNEFNKLLKFTINYNDKLLIKTRVSIPSIHHFCRFSNAHIKLSKRKSAAGKFEKRCLFFYINLLREIITSAMRCNALHKSVFFAFNRATYPSAKQPF